MQGRPSLWRGSFAGFIGLVVVWAGSASASEPSVTLTRIPGTDAVELDGEIPISGSFTLRHAVYPETRSATLQVWPVAIQPDCGGEPPPYDAPQTHVIEMALADAAPTRWASATVPHLQNDRMFCFRVQSSEGVQLPLDGALGLIGSHVAAESIDELGPWADALARDVLRTACAAAEASHRNGERVLCEPGLWRAALKTRLMTTVLASPLPRARARRAAAEQSRDRAVQALRPLKARLAELAPVVAPGRGLDLSGDSALAMSPTEMVAARAALDARVPAEKAWRRWLEQVEVVAASLDEATARYAASNDAVEAQTAALETALDEATADFLSTEVRAERQGKAATGTARSRDANNYAAGVAGVAVGWPVHGGGPWLLTYAGAHVFAEPVERSIPFDEMVGGTLWQRLSLFVGAVTSSPGPLDRAQVSPGFSGAYPGLGLGWRLTQHLAFDAIGFLYTAADDDLLSERAERGVAFTAGLAAELDLIQWLTPD